MLLIGVEIAINTLSNENKRSNAITNTLDLVM